MFVLTYKQTKQTEVSKLSIYYKAFFDIYKWNLLIFELFFKTAQRSLKSLIVSLKIIILLAKFQYKSLQKTNFKNSFKLSGLILIYSKHSLKS